MEAKSKIFSATDVNYALNSIVSKNIVKKPGVTLTLFAFDKGESLSEHTTLFEAMVFIIEGKAEITVGEELNLMSSGQIIILPANIPHAVKANERFKMMLMMIQN
jgi:quercetin dioxygenase-like cupin family protein